MGATPWRIGPDPSTSVRTIIPQVSTNRSGPGPKGDVFLRQRRVRFVHGGPPPMFYKVRIAAAGGVAALAIFGLAHARPAHSAPPVPPDGAGRAIVVFGAAVKPDGTPSDRLRGRVERALELHRADPAAAIVVSGGDRTGHSEARLMKRLLLGLGVPKDRVLLEPRARHTGENADFSAALVKHIGARRVTLVTSSSHSSRALFHLRWALRAAGVGRARVDVAGTGPRPSLRSRLRESVKLARDVYFRLRDSFGLTPHARARVTRNRR